MNGVVGLHVGFGGSRDQSVRYAHEFGGAYAVVLNDPALCKQLEENGVVGIYRIKTAEWDDDNAHQHFDPEPYLRLADAHLRGAGVVKRHVHWNNEPGNQDRALLRRRLRRAIEVAHELGIILVVLNIAYRNWTLDDWDYFADELALIKQYGYFVGVHEGYSWELTTLATAFPESIGRFIESQNKYGFKVIVTEFAASLSPHDGWSEWLTETEWLSLLRQAVEEVYAPRGVPVCLYTLYPWQRGFDYHGDNAKYFRAGVGQLNAAFPLVTPPAEPEENPVTQIVNMQEHVCPVDGALYHLNSGEVMQCYYDAEGYGRQGKNALWEEMWVKTINGVPCLMRGMDVSQYPTASGGKVYGLFADNTLAEYGTPWCPVSLEVGKVYRRRVWVQWFNAQTGAKIAQGSGWDETYFKIVAYHNTWTTFEGVQVSGVAECVYGHLPDLSNVKERYYYGKRKGLVGFIDYNFNPPKQTVITREQPPSRPTPVSLSWWTRPPLEKPPVPQPYPDPTTLGDPVNGVITATRSNVANVRADPTTSGKFLTTVKTGDAVVYRPTPFENDGYKWTWLVSHSGWVSDVATIGAPPKPVEPLIIDLPAPYVSQTNSDADKYANDCMIAVLLMLTRTWFVRKGLRAPLVPTVDDLAPYTPLPVKDPLKLGLNFNDIAALGLLTGFEVEYVRPLTPDKIVRFLDEGKVVGALVTENKINPDGKAIAHAVAVKGYSESTFNLHDPNNTSDYRIDRDQLVTAMTGVPGNLFDAQGFVLKAA